MVEVIEFETDGPQLAGRMTLTTTLEDVDGGANVVIRHDGIPAGLSLEDNEVGTRMALDNLATLVEEDASRGRDAGPNREIRP